MIRIHEEQQKIEKRLYKRGWCHMGWGVCTNKKTKCKNDRELNGGSGFKCPLVDFAKRSLLCKHLEEEVVAVVWWIVFMAG